MTAGVGIGVERLVPVRAVGTVKAGMGGDHFIIRAKVDAAAVYIQPVAVAQENQSVSGDAAFCHGGLGLGNALSAGNPVVAVDNIGHIHVAAVLHILFQHTQKNVGLVILVRNQRQHLPIAKDLGLALIHILIHTVATDAVPDQQ